MKKIQKYRFAVQSLCVILTMISFFVNFKITMMVLMVLTLFSGAFYCGWVCPYGFLQDIFSKLGTLLGIKKKKMPRNIQRFLVFFRYIILIVVSLIAADIIFSIMKFEPRANFESLLLGKIASWGTIAIILVFALISLFFERPFCNYLCSQGARIGIVSSLRLVTIKRDTSICVNCKKCDIACPMNIEVSKANNLRSLQCINCFQCISSCPVEGALSYGRIPITKKIRYALASFALVAVVVGVILFINNFGAKDMKTLEKSSLDTTSVPQTVDETGIKEGVYSGTGEGYKGSINVEVTVKDEKIVKIEVIDHSEDKMWFDQANSVIPDRIIDSQSTDVELVSGATYTSEGIRDAVKNAMEKANNE